MRERSQALHSFRCSLCRDAGRSANSAANVAQHICRRAEGPQRAPSDSYDKKQSNGRSARRCPSRHSSGRRSVPAQAAFGMTNRRAAAQLHFAQPPAVSQRDGVGGRGQVPSRIECRYTGHLAKGSTARSKTVGSPIDARQIARPDGHAIDVKTEVSPSPATSDPARAGFTQQLSRYAVDCLALSREEKTPLNVQRMNGHGRRSSRGAPASSSHAK